MKTPEKKEAAARTTAPVIELHNESYCDHAPKSSRKMQIAERRAQIPKLYRALYDRAVAGKSRKAAMHSFCIECCGYQIKEVFLCSDSACPLFPYRIRSRVLHGASESVRERSGLKNCEQRGLWVGNG